MLWILVNTLRPMKLSDTIYPSYKIIGGWSHLVFQMHKFVCSKVVTVAFGFRISAVKRGKGTNLASQTGKREPAGSASGQHSHDGGGGGLRWQPSVTLWLVRIQNISLLFLYIFKNWTSQKPARLPLHHSEVSMETWCSTKSCFLNFNLPKKSLIWYTPGGAILISRVSDELLPKRVSKIVDRNPGGECYNLCR